MYTSKSEEAQPIALTMRQPSFAVLREGFFETKGGEKADRQDLVFEPSAFEIGREKALRLSTRSTYKTMRMNQANLFNKNIMFDEEDDDENDMLNRMWSMKMSYPKDRASQITMKLKQINESRWETMGYVPTSNINFNLNMLNSGRKCIDA